MAAAEALAAALGVTNAVADVGKTAWDIFTQNKTWDREDTAIQRRVADLKAAGLSPTLAAGNAASTSSPIAINKPDLAGDIIDPRVQAQAMLKQKQDIAQSQAETDYLNQQAWQMSQENKVREKMYGLVDENGRDGYTQEAQARLQSINAAKDQLLNGARRSQFDALTAETGSETAKSLRKQAEVNASEAEWNFNMLHNLGLTTHGGPGGAAGQAVAAAELLYQLFSKAGNVVSSGAKDVKK